MLYEVITGRTEQIAFEVHAAPLPRYPLHVAVHRRLDARVCIADDQRNAVQAAIFQATKDFRPRRLTLAVAKPPIEYLALPEGIDACRDQHCLADDPPVDASFFVAGIDQHIREWCVVQSYNFV